MINKTILNIFKINKKNQIKKALLYLLLITFISNLLFAEKVLEFEVNEILILKKNDFKVTKILTKKSDLSNNNTISIYELFKDLVISDSINKIEISTQDSIFNFKLDDIINKKNKATAFLIADKIISKLEKVDSISLSDVNGQINVKDLDNIFFSEASQTLKIGPNKVTKEEVDVFFNNPSIIFIQDFDTKRWIRKPKTIRIYYK